MYKVLGNPPRFRLFQLFSCIMSKNYDKAYYAVGRGRETGIYDSWKDCQAQIDKFPQAKYRKFFSIEEAKEFVEFWKNYESPKTSPNRLLPESVSKFSKKKEIINVERGRGRGKNFNGTCKQKNFLGIQENKKNNTKGKSLTCYVSPYISPLSSSLKDSEYCQSNKRFRNNFKSEKGTRIAEVVDLIADVNQINSKCQPSSLKAGIRPSKKTFPFRVSEQNTEPTSSISPDRSLTNSVALGDGTRTPVRPVIPKSAKVSERVNSEIASVMIEKSIKKEVLEVDECSEANIEEGNLSDLSNKLTSCLGVLESALKVVTKSCNNTNDCEKLKKSLIVLLERIVSVTNASVNPQIETEENADRKCEDSRNSENVQLEEVQSTARKEVSPLPQPEEQHQPQSQTPRRFESVSPRFSSFEGRSDQQNVDVLALNLRLDSFEKRFDACLKEVGAIVSEISHIKTELKEMKESLSSKSPYSSSYSPRKSKSGLMQTTLNFGENKAEDKSNSVFQQSSRSYSSSKDDIDSEPPAKRGRNLKRKLSRNDSESSQGGGNDDILSRIKVEKVDYTSFEVDSDEYVEVYTDGACHSNGKNEAKAGIGIWFGDSHPLNVAEPVEGSATNNSAEIQAARVAIELAIKAGISKLKIHTDSEFLINCATKWIHRWKKNGWTLVNGGKVKNRKELEKLDKLASKIKVRWEKVEAHVGIKGNEMADRLANEGAAKYRR